MMIFYQHINIKLVFINFFFIVYLKILVAHLLIAFQTKMTLSVNHNG